MFAPAFHPAMKQVAPVRRELGVRTVFNLMGLSDPHDARYSNRVKRFIGFYMNEDPGAPNYDPEHRIIKSMMNGRRGPLSAAILRMPNGAFGSFRSMSVSGGFPAQRVRFIDDGV